jgi:hypothetical protein
MAVEAPGGLLRFDGVSASTIRSLIAGGPPRIAEQASGDGPQLSLMIDLADQFDGVLGGFLSAEDRADLVCFCDTLVVPADADTEAIEALAADEVVLLDDGCLRLWWD